ncbi:MAG: alcohol dehydrogenase catalytic domain-containing protein [Candidatus Eisenbacteria bacterium]
MSPTKAEPLRLLREREDPVRAVLMDGRGGVTLGEIPKPRVPKGGALIRVTAVGICGSDTHKFGRAPRGTILGHEVAGVVERLGRGARGFRVGERIVVAHHVPCGRCPYCRADNHSQCALFRTTNLRPGGWAEFVAVSDMHLRHAAFSLPAALDEGTASLTEPLACCVRAVRRSGIRKGDEVVVVGLGPVGLMLAALYRREGARVHTFDRVAARAVLARKWAGASPLPPGGARAAAALRRRTGARGADQAVLSAGAASTFPLALEMVRRGGTVHLFSGPDEGTSVDVDLNLIYKREVRVLATYSSSPADLRESFRLIREGVLPVAGLITHRLPLSRIEEGLRLIRSGKALKVILEPGGRPDRQGDSP